MNILLAIFSFILVLVCLFMILFILMQKSQSGGGLGSAMGGGMAESAFGAETDNVLVKLTRNSTIVFFVLSFGLYLGHLYVNGKESAITEELPALTAPELIPVEETVETESDAIDEISEGEESISFKLPEETAETVEEKSEEVAP
jgi:preprotein translocase subunit SecG